MGLAAGEAVPSSAAATRARKTHELRQIGVLGSKEEERDGGGGERVAPRLGDGEGVERGGVKGQQQLPQPTISWKVVTHCATSLTKSRNFCYVMLVVYRTYLIGFTRSQKVVTRCGTSAKVVDQMPPE